MDRQLGQADSLETLSEVVVDSPASTVHLRTLHGKKVFSALSLSLSLSLSLCVRRGTRTHACLMYPHICCLSVVWLVTLFHFSVNLCLLCNRGGRFFYVLHVWSSLLNITDQLTAFTCFR